MPNELGVPVATALRETLREGYSGQALRRDIVAGLTVGVIAVPLAMALAIASGVAPQYGLYTSIVAGIVIALAGGSRVNISGPTAAFVVILLPIVHKFGLGGLLVATVMSGIILVVMGLARMGQLIQFIPYPVTTGFTAGIAVVIATLQLKDFLGLSGVVSGEHFLDKLWLLLQAIPTAHWPDVFIGSLTLLTLVLWPRLKIAIPGHLIALVVGSLLAWSLALLNEHWQVATIGSRFSYEANGVVGHGIPPFLPQFVWPWQLPDANGQPLGLSWPLIRDLMGPALGVAMLGAIESLLCAVVADGMTGKRHDPNAELVGQGLGNIIAPFFGGITATAAIARTAANIRSGGVSPLAAIVHALTVLAAVMVFAKVMAHIPMAALAALLMMVAWNMSEAKHFLRVTRVAPGSDVAVLLACFSLTVLFDMVLAVSVGVVLAAVLFIKRMADLTDARLVQPEERAHPKNLPTGISIYDINGPLFFGAAEKAVSVLSRVDGSVRVVIVDLADVPTIDMTGIVALQSLVDRLNKRSVGVVLANLSPRIYRKLLKAGMKQEPAKLACALDMEKATAAAVAMLSAVLAAATAKEMARGSQG